MHLLVDLQEKAANPADAIVDDAGDPARARPLYVDLNGTLIETDLLWESALGVVRDRPALPFRAPAALMRGRQHLKALLASGCEIDPATLPYRTEVLDLVRAARAQGRQVILTTGAPLSLAESVADHLGLFDDVIATTDERNVRGVNKRDAILEHLEPAQVARTHVPEFAYVGDAVADRPVFEAASEALVVAPGGRAPRRIAGLASPLEVPARGIRPVLKALRLHQWSKNVFVFMPIGLAQSLPTPEMIAATLVAFFAFSFIASATYLVNDLLDLKLDRAHRTKRERPLAAGTLSVPRAMLLGVALFAAGVGCALMLPVAFQALLALYVVCNLAYSLALKRMLLIDVVTLAGLHTLRVIAGGAAAGLAVSFWLIAFTLFLFLSLALVKRYTELQHIGRRAERSRTGRGYRAEDLEMIALAGMCSAFSSVLVLALYINSDNTVAELAHPWVLWPICPLVLYVLMRIWILARRREMDDDPVAFAITDWRSQLMLGLACVTYLVAPHV